MVRWFNSLYLSPSLQSTMFVFSWPGVMYPQSAHAFHFQHLSRSECFLQHLLCIYSSCARNGVKLTTLPSYIPLHCFAKNALMIGCVRSVPPGSHRYTCQLRCQTSECDEDSSGGWCLMSSLQPSSPIFPTKVKRLWDVDSDHFALSWTTIKLSI